MSNYIRPELPKCDCCERGIATFTCDKCGKPGCPRCLTVTVYNVADFCKECVTIEAATTLSNTLKGA